MSALTFPALPSARGPRGRDRHEVPAGGVGLRVRRMLVAAMEQQMWFFGCDAACADGNLLVRYGFERHRAALPRGQSSCYRFFWRGADEGDAGAQVSLHGWSAGLHSAPDGSAPGGFLYLRGGNRLGWYHAPEPPSPDGVSDAPLSCPSFRSLGCRPEPAFRRTATLFLRWLEEYENWVEATCGGQYRRRCHARAPLPWLPPSQGRAWLAAYRTALF